MKISVPIDINPGHAAAGIITCKVIKTCLKIIASKTINIKVASEDIVNIFYSEQLWKIGLNS